MRRSMMIMGVAASLSLIAFVYIALSPSAPPGDSELTEVNQQAEKRDLEGLKQSAQSSNLKVAAGAVQAYARVGGTSGTDVMQQFMADPRPAVRAQAASGWSYVGSATNAKPLTKLVARDPSPQVRIAALQSLNTLKAWDELGVVLDRMAEDADPTVRRAAMRTFEEVAFLRINKSYDPDAAAAARRAAIVPLRQFVNRPVAREMYAEWTARNQHGPQ